MNEQFELPELRDYIAGEWRTPDVALDAWVENPHTGDRVQPQRATSEAGIEAALAAADHAHRFSGWNESDPDERAAALDGMADALDPKQAHAASLEAATSGAVIGATSMLAFIIPGAFRLAAEMLRTGMLSSTMPGPRGDVQIRKSGWGPALSLVPWNAPAPMAAHKAASALAAGCPVIIKPPERAPHGSAVLAEAADEVGLPAGLVQLVHGGPRQGGVLVNDARVRAVSFTGGIVGGRDIATACAVGLKPVQLELGGHSPVVIMEDCPADMAAAAVVALMTTLNGQWCRALGRLLVPESRVGEILDAVGESMQQLVIGDPLSPESMMGPIVHSDHLAFLKNTIDRLESAGGTRHEWSAVPQHGNYLAPTLITGLDPSLTRDEIFGPVGTVHTFRDADEAVAIANGTDYGLEAYVFGADEDAAMSVARRIRAGGVKVNGASPMSLNLMAPRPAWGVSGLQIEGTTETIEFFCGTTVVGVEGMEQG